MNENIHFLIETCKVAVIPNALNCSIQTANLKGKNVNKVKNITQLKNCDGNFLRFLHDFIFFKRKL